MLKLIKWAIHRQCFFDPVHYGRDAKAQKNNFCASKELEIQRVLKMHKWARHGQYGFYHVYSGRGESKS
jgi:hypothetical protein